MSIAEPISPSISTASTASAASAAPSIGATDGELLLRFSKHGCQQSFAQLVDAHGPLVWATCRQVLCHHDDVEDAFQATFLILARRAKDIRASDSAAPWLYRVAYRTSLALSRHRRAHPVLPLDDREVLDDRPDPLEHLHQQHMVAVLVEELRALPARYQAPLVLCYLEGRSRTAVAEVLDCTVATVKGRLARGRQLLRQRLARRGVALSLAATAAAAAVTQAKTALAGSTLPTATASAALTPITPSGEVVISTTVSQLVQQGASAMTYASLVKPVAAVAATLLLGMATAVALDEPAPDAAPGGNVIAATDDLTVDLGAVASAGDADMLPEEEAGPAIEIAAHGPPGTRAAGVPPTGVGRHAPSPPGIAQAVERRHVTPQAQFRNDVLFTRDPSQPMRVSLDAGPSLMQLELMQKHWEAKAEGLRLKASALEQEAQQENSPMKRAEAKLAEAESYQADAERIAVEAQIMRQRQPMPVQVDPVMPQPVPAQIGWTPIPAEASPSALPPGMLLRLLVDRHEERGPRRQTLYILGVDAEGKVALPWDFDLKVKASDLATLEAEIKEHVARHIETTSPAKVGRLEVVVRPFTAPQPAPQLEERPVLQPSVVRESSAEVEEMRRQVEQLRRELDAARQQPRLNPVLPPTQPPGPPTLSAPPTPPSVPGMPEPARDPGPPPTQRPIPQSPQPAEDPSSEIEQLRRRLEQLEKELHPPVPTPTDPNSTFVPGE